MMNLRHTPLLLASMAIALGSIVTPALGGESPTQSGSPSDEVQTLRSQIQAQKLLIDQYQRKLQDLEQKLEKASNASSLPPMGSLDKQASLPPASLASTKQATALEQSLQLRGISLLPSGAVRINNGLSWSHYGTGITREDSYKARMGLDVGLPGAMMLSVAVPFASQNYAIGNSKGVGDISISLARELLQETRSAPSIVGSISYTHNNGKDPFEQVPIGSGFKALSANLSVLKHISPMAVYGSLGISHPYSRQVSTLDGSPFNGNIAPANSYSASLGASLAVSPSASVNMGWSYTRNGATLYQPGSGDPFLGTPGNAGYIQLGAGFALTKNWYLDITAAAGVTRDAWDHIFTISLPYRF